MPVWWEHHQAISRGPNRADRGWWNVISVPLRPSNDARTNMKLSLFLFAAVCVALTFANTTKPPTHHVTKHVVDAEAAHGHAKAGDKHEEHKHVKKTGKDSKHHVETAHKGNHGSISHKIIDDEKALKKSASHSEGGHQSHKKAGAHQEHGAKFQEAAKHKKTGFAKGFHENYHKNEQKQHDSFYSHGKKSADWKSFAGKNSKHASHKADKVEYKNKMALKSLEQHGKAGKKASGHSISDHKSHKAEKAKKNAHFEKQQKWGKKHVKPENKQKYKYVQSH